MDQSLLPSLCKYSNRYTLLYDKTNGNIQWRIYWAGKADKHSYYNKVQLHLIAIYKEDKQKFMLAIKNGISIIRPLYLQLKVIIDYLLAV